MSNKEKYIAELRAQHPDAPIEFLEFCYILRDYDKATKYADELASCTNYRDIANKVVYLMYINGDIDEQRAKSEKFLETLIPLACLDFKGNGHAAVHHVRNMFVQSDAHARRKDFAAERAAIWHASQKALAEEKTMQMPKIEIQITDINSMRLFLSFLESAGTKYTVIENKHFNGHVMDHRPKESIVIEETPQWLDCAFADLQAHWSEASKWTFGYESDWTTNSNISLSELLELIKEELS